MEKIDREAIAGLVDREDYRKIFSCLKEYGRVDTSLLSENIGKSREAVYKLTKEMEKVNVIKIDFEFLDSSKTLRSNLYSIKNNGAAKAFEDMVKRFEKKNQISTN